MAPRVASQVEDLGYMATGFGIASCEDLSSPMVRRRRSCWRAGATAARSATRFCSSCRGAWRRASTTASRPSRWRSRCGWSSRRRFARCGSAYARGSSRARARARGRRCADGDVRSATRSRRPRWAAHRRTAVTASDGRSRLPEAVRCRDGHRGALVDDDAPTTLDRRRLRCGHGTDRGDSTTNHPVEPKESSCLEVHSCLAITPRP